MDKIFSPNTTESKWSQVWEEQGDFEPKGTGKPYTIVIPPPNVTGALHMGHALNNTIQDVLIRWKRKEGYRALYQPGTDHAGIATQSVVEKTLAKEKLTRHDLGREKFIEKVWEWKEQYGNRIIEQLKRLGCSCDWSKNRFTMDAGLSEAVQEVFIRLYQEGLIYHGTRLVNWCPQLQTALADEEVETRDTPGKFYHLRYPLQEDPSQYIVVSTTRPETLFGDVAVAVNPTDDRYKHLIGKMVVLPFIHRAIPIIGDDHADPTKGSGAVKITPAHDSHDFEVGQRHQLPQIVVMNPDATMNELTGPFAGLNRFECRKQCIEQLQALGLLEGEEDRMTPIPYCYRTGDVIEPRLMGQWFVAMKSLAEPAIASVREGRTRFIPSRYAKTYFDWLEQFRDWCISRQIWWGHRIPAYYVVSETGGARTEQTPLLVCRTLEEAKKEALEKFGPSAQIEQEEDVLDTWFSSALWPFSTLGWPQETELLKTHYPTDVLVTARDIIYFWVARMMFSGLKYLGKEPFHTVYINGTILDAKGQRMSKSKGNGIDPIEMIEQYGADAVRFSLLTLTGEGQDIKLSPTKFEMGRNFANKIWNAVRFIHPQIEELKKSEPSFFTDLTLPSTQSFETQDLTHQWILSELEVLIEQTEQNLENFRFADACMGLYHFLWDNFCSRFLEVKKQILTQTTWTSEKQESLKIFLYVLRKSIDLLHPFMPYISEEINAQLGFTDRLIVSKWPKANQKHQNPFAAKSFEKAISIVEGVRSIRGTYSISPVRELSVYIQSDSAEPLHQDQIFIIRNLENIENLKEIKSSEKPQWSATSLIPGGQIHIPLLGILDPQVEKKKIEKELEKVKGFLVSLEKKLENKNFTDHAPEEVVNFEKEKLASQKEKMAKLQTNLLELNSVL